MANEFEVVCVDHGMFPGQGSRIIRLGIRVGDRIEVLDRDVLMGRMQRGARFFVNRDHRKVFLVFGVSDQGRGFVQTTGDDSLLNNLAALPVCKGNEKITYGTGVSDPFDVDAGFDGGDVGGGGGGGDADQGDND